MDAFVVHANRLRIKEVLSISIVNGGFVAVGIAWKDALAGVVSEWLGTSDSTPAKLLNAVITTCFVCACVFLLARISRFERPDAEPPVRTTPVKR